MPGMVRVYSSLKAPTLILSSTGASMAKVAKIGDVEVARIFDTVLLGYTAQAWFPKFDREALRPYEGWLCPVHYDRESGRFPMPVSSYLLRITGKNILIDTCLGNDKERPGMPETHRLATCYLDRLSQEGLRPEDIDFVLCTHLHVDHVGWNTRLLNGRWIPTFPNAQYVVSRKEYEGFLAFLKRPATPQVDQNYYNDSVLPIVEADKMVLVDDFHEMLGCIRLVPYPGHSPNHVSIELRSQGSTAAFVGDLLHSPIQVPMWQWSTVIDTDQEQAARSRRKLLEFCCTENVLLVPGHFEAPYAGRIRPDGDTFSIDFGW